jgi:V-type H+-transporting ATPase subunit a
MGIFATFNGFIYNEFFAMPQDLFGSCYERDPRVLTLSVDQNGNTNGFNTYGFVRKPGCVYSFGMDPRWFQSDAALVYFNGYKMKLSVIFAILQMSLGIFLKGFNSLYFRKTQDLLFEFIP